MIPARSLCLTILLAASAAWPAPPAPSPQGYVYANLPSEDPEAPIILTSIADNKEHALKSIENSVLPERGSWLPAGEYKLSRFGQSRLEGYPAITVAEGRVTDLGSFVFFGLGANNIVLLPIRQPLLSKFSKQAVERVRSQLSNPEPILWTVDKTPEPYHPDPGATGLGVVADLIMAYDRKVNTPPLLKGLREAKDAAEFLKLAKSALAPRSMFPESDPDGNLYFPAAMGQIRLRSANGKWSSLDTGSLRNIRTVYYKDGDLYAGFEDGVILKSGDRGVTWNEWASLSPGLTVVDIKCLGKKWIVVGSKSTYSQWNGSFTEQITVFEHSEETPGSLTSIKEMTAHTIPAWPSHGQVWKDAYYLSAPPNVFKLDIPSMTWRSLAIPISASAFRIHPESGFMTAYFQKGIFSKMVVSSDQGTTWKKTNTPPNAFLAAIFTTPSNGLALRLNRGAFTVTLEEYEYQAATDVWVKIADCPNGYQGFVLDREYAPRFLISRNGNILRFNGTKFEEEFVFE